MRDPAIRTLRQVEHRQYQPAHPGFQRDVFRELAEAGEAIVNSLGG